MAAILVAYNVGGTLYFPLIGSGTAAFVGSGSGSLIGTNIRVSLDGGAFATSTNTGTYVGNGWYKVVYTAPEASAKQIAWDIAGSGATLGTVVEAQGILLHTYGNVSAYYPFDFGTALSAQTVGTVTTVLGGTIGTITGTASVNVVQILGTAVVGTSGTLTNVGTVGSVGSANLTQILGTAVIATSGTLTNVGTVSTALGTVNADVKLLDGSATAAQQLAKSAFMIQSGTATGTRTNSSFETNLVETSDNHYNGRIIIFIDGSLQYQATEITGYDGVAKKLVVVPMTEAPGIGAGFVII